MLVVLGTWRKIDLYEIMFIEQTSKLVLVGSFFLFNDGFRCLPQGYNLMM